MPYECTEERFLKDVQQHRMKVFHDSQCFRFLRFACERTNVYYFDLITWSAKLCISGELGTRAFQQVEDMFEFVE
jgi:hypothetical protein